MTKLEFIQACNGLKTGEGFAISIDHSEPLHLVKMAADYHSLKAVSFGEMIGLVEFGVNEICVTRNNIPFNSSSQFRTKFFVYYSQIELA